MSHSACACTECQAMCHRRPCWPTPTDAQALMAAGYSHDLMLDWWVDPEQQQTVYLLTPAIAGRESHVAPPIPNGRCTFLDTAGLCRLHDSGLKPTEGQLALCQNRTPPDLHEQIGRTWNNPAGRALIHQWESDPPRGRQLAFVVTAKGRR